MHFAARGLPGDEYAGRGAELKNWLGRVRQVPGAQCAGPGGVDQFSSRH